MVNSSTVNGSALKNSSLNDSLNYRLENVRVNSPECVNTKDIDGNDAEFTVL